MATVFPGAAGAGRGGPRGEPRQAFYNELITGTRAGFGWAMCWKMIVHTRMYAHT